MMTNWTHIPILAQQIATLLITDKNAVYLDGTLGLGGHTKILLQHLSKDGRILGVDKDHKALAMAVENVADNRLKTFQGSYLEAPKILKTLGLNYVQGALFDLGLSSYQLDDARRGFSLMKSGPLDMRFDNSRGQTAADIVNTWPADKLEDIFLNYGQERAASRIALAICAARRENKITDTLTLASLVEKCVPRFGRTHPATKVFQALRIAVNDELNTVAQAPKMLEQIIAVGGRAAFLTFHSTEDRIIKNAFKDLVANGNWRLINKKIIVPEREEILQNQRARSAGLRVIERLK